MLWCRFTFVGFWSNESKGECRQTSVIRRVLRYALFTSDGCVAACCWRCYHLAMLSSELSSCPKSFKSVGGTHLCHHHGHVPNHHSHGRRHHHQSEPSQPDGGQSAASPPEERSQAHEPASGLIILLARGQYSCPGEPQLTVSGEESNGSTVGTGTSGTTNTMDVILRVVGVVVVEHVSDVTNIFSEKRNMLAVEKHTQASYSNELFQRSSAKSCRQLPQL